MKWLEQAWYRPRLAPFLYLLLPLSLLFWLLSSLRRNLYRLRILKPYRAPLPVVVVGNISVGGTGKTPAVLAIVKSLQSQGWQPAIISRGYGGQGPFPQTVSATSAASAVGDEPKLLQRRSQVPVVVAPKRRQAIEHLLQETPNIDVVVSDDGLQHYALSRDAEIIIIDAQRGLGNGLLLPAGPLREPAARLKQAEWVVANSAQHPFARFEMQLQALPWRRVKDDREIELPDGEAVIAIAGIGNPQRFFNTLKQQGIEIVETGIFADHYAYSQVDFERFNRRYPIVMTEKDAAKCAGFAPSHWYYLPVEAQLPDDLLTELNTALRRKYSHQE
ncbi:tetraacyldisaccharide 4'-kinase [Idiomarina xiamenensis]|uniref:Tetraacyldisaccharide 4'-kinase n=1 Tax=Idiomarina xiamenensis 10-D-4 TaxID=740709 RepID=K2KK25_9GAMM|nr:tetraacyldisaccharide 4'-kinase [Idiomarina xiamenensis]EKE82964.1 tetraacyldisaccharide-1-P 4'-kinase [Idiomarina xiamenensis 10-D-4]